MMERDEHVHAFFNISHTIGNITLRTITISARITVTCCPIYILYPATNTRTHSAISLLRLFFLSLFTNTFYVFLKNFTVIYKKCIDTGFDHSFIYNINE